MVFEQYAPYYDGLYRDKDYAAEVDFVEQLFHRHAAGPVRRLLELGCGTGGHAGPLSQRGYRVTAIDRSEPMLALAREKLRAARTPVELVQADLRAVALGRTFDAVIAMFAVISYQATVGDIGQAFATARRHLQPGGLFVFDAWFGPGVLLDPPSARSKTTVLDGEEVTRSARPTLDLLAQTVRVDYRLTRRPAPAAANGAATANGVEGPDPVEESHLLRFLFPGEVELLAAAARFQVAQVCPFLDPHRPPTPRDWNATWVLRAV